MPDPKDEGKRWKRKSFVTAGEIWSMTGLLLLVSRRSITGPIFKMRDRDDKRVAAVWFNSYKRRLNVVTAGQLSSVESSVSYWRPEAVTILTISVQRKIGNHMGLVFGNCLADTELRLVNLQSRQKRPGYKWKIIQQKIRFSFIFG